MARTVVPHPGGTGAGRIVRALSGRAPAEERQRLVQENIGFVIKVACEYRNLGLPLEDLIGEGSVGLTQAASRYDPRRGAKFVTYAAAWVRKSILRALSQNTRTIRIPSYHQDKLREVQRTEAFLCTELGRHPDREELSRRLSTTGVRVDALLNSRIHEVPLDALENPEGRASLLRALADPRATDPERALLQDESHWIVEHALGLLDPRERLIIVSRFGLASEARASLGDLASVLRLSRERVRQIEERAKQKIRRHLEKKLLCPGAPGSTMRRKVARARRRTSPRPEKGQGS